MTGVLIGAAQRFLQFVNTPAVPAAGESKLYFKNDGLPYCLAPDGVERPLVEQPSSLHLNPTFDQLGGSSGVVEWTTFWMAGGDTMVPDSSAGNFVSGSAIKVTHLGGTANGRVQELSSHAITDTQRITFNIWAKASVANFPVVLNHVTSATSSPDYFTAGSFVTARNISVGTTWKRYSVQFTVPAGHLFGRFDMVPNSTAPAGTVWFDESSSSAFEAAAPGVATFGRIVKTGSQNPGTGVRVGVTFQTNAAGSSPSTFADAANNRLVVPVAGIYVLTAYLPWDASNATGHRSLYVVLNGATDIGAGRNFPNSGVATHCTYTTIRQFAAGDLLTMDAQQASGAANSFTNAELEMALVVGL